MPRELRFGVERRHRCDDNGYPALPQVCVGDKESDLELGRALGCPTVLVETGEGRTTRRRLEAEGRLDHAADHVAADLAAALPFLSLTLLGEPRS